MTKNLITMTRVCQKEAAWMDWTRLANNLRKHGRDDIVKRHCPKADVNIKAIDEAIGNARYEFHGFYCWFNGSDWILEGGKGPVIIIDAALARRINTCAMDREAILSSVVIGGEA